MRLQKFLALQAVSSRRKAEEHIIAGDVLVNGKVAKIGDVIDPTVDEVTLNGVSISNNIAILQKQPLVLMLNKPSGCVCSHADKYNPFTIFDLIQKEFAKKKLLFCGRLDKETEGMIIITDNGDFAQKITHPSSGIKKHYEVLLSRHLTENVIKQSIRGITDNGEFLKFEKIISIGKGRMRGLAYEIVLSQGKKNEIHRVFEHFGIFVKSLKRTRIGGLSMHGVATGKCRRLTEKEIQRLFE